MSTDGRHGIAGIESIGGRGVFLVRRLGAQAAVGMEIERCWRGVRRWPGVTGRPLAAMFDCRAGFHEPFAAAHDEVAHRFGLIQTCGQPLEPVVEPAQIQCVAVRQGRIGLKRQISGDCRAGAAVMPWPHQHMHRRFAPFAQLLKVFHHCQCVGVIPAADVQTGHVGMLVIVRAWAVARLLPVVVIGRVCGYIYGPLLIGGHKSQWRVAFAQGVLFGPCPHICPGLFQSLFQRRICCGFTAGRGHRECIGEKAHLQRAVVAHRAVVVARWAEQMDYRCQMRRI